MAKKQPAADASPVVVLLVDHAIDGIAYPAGTPLQIDAACAESLLAGGIADGAEAAVAYRVAELGMPVVVHVPPATE